MSLLIGVSLIAIVATQPPADPKAPPPPPVPRAYGPLGPPAPPAPMSEELRRYLETRGARPARFRYGSIGFEDYPVAALRADEEGTVGFRYVVGPDGRVTSCEIVESSGSAVLDATTCVLVQRRFRFYPAQDEKGNAIAETHTQRVVYSLPDEPPPEPAVEPGAPEARQPEPEVPPPEPPPGA